jgi:threonine aldolase
MNTSISLSQAFQQSTYPLTGHGKRNIQVLMDAFRDMDGEMDSDLYGKGKLIEEFQEQMARHLGKESAVFFPSGTMAQQIALRIWCDANGLKRVAYHPLSHLELHEEDGLKKLHHIEPVLLGDISRPVGLEDVLGMKEDVSCVLLELPQREIGGQLPPYRELEEISAYCRGKGIRLHMDGARLFEILPYYEKSAEEICALFDSVYISFYKGIGGIAGAVLAGTGDFIKEAVIWKRRHGGDLISLYPYIVSAGHYFRERLPKMGQYYREAKELAVRYNQCHGLRTVPVEPVSNMFHVHAELPKEKLETLLIGLYGETGVGLTSYLKETDNGCAFEVTIGDRYSQAPKAQLEHAFQMLHNAVTEVHG